VNIYAACLVANSGK